MNKVVILQEYIPAYRARFFELLVSQGSDVGIDIRIAHGFPNRQQARRSDAVSISASLRLEQVELGVTGRRLVLRRIRQAISGADLVIMEQARRNLDAYFLLGTPRTRRPLVGLWGHGMDYTRPSDRVSMALQKWLTVRADWFFAYTSGGLEAVKDLGFPPDKVTVVRNSVDTSGLCRDIQALGAAELRGFAELYDLRGKTAIYLGALSESKRLPFLLSAAEDVHSRDPDFRLLLMGDGEEREQVERFVQRNRWSSYLERSSGERKALALACSEVMLMPGRVGLAAVDSFAAQTPIISTKWPWHAPEFEYLVPNQNAVITDDDRALYAEAISATLGHRPTLDALRDGCAMSAKLYTIEHMAANFLRGIQSALDGGRQ
ncbi:glycosyltransferase family 4 protein [Sinomonas sp. RB5]